LFIIKPQSDNDEAMSEISVTPFVDVMLVLVIILLVTAPITDAFSPCELTENR
jgi:biopolymer transport protein ExbD